MHYALTDFLYLFLNQIIRILGSLNCLKMLYSSHYRNLHSSKEQIQLVCSLIDNLIESQCVAARSFTRLYYDVILTINSQSASRHLLQSTYLN